MKKIIKNFIILLLMLSFAQVANAKFRDVNSTGFENDTEEIMDELEDVKNTSIETVNAIKDNNEKLYGIVGKSQVLNFDRDIERVSITNDAVADVVVLSPKQLLVNGKQAGATSIIFWSENSKKPVFYNLVIQQNTDSFIQAVEHVAPNENISIIFNNEGAVITGKISSTAVKEKIKNVAAAYNINLTDLTESPTKQVLLEVKITEASKSFARELGVNLLSGRYLDMSKGDKFNINGWTATGSGDYKTHILQTGQNGLSLGYINNKKFGIDLEASEAKGDIKILAEPRLLAVNGEEGSFTVGNELPVPSGVGNWGNVSFTYKDTGVVLKFTPKIMEETGRIRLDLKPEISEVDESYSVVTGDGTKVYALKTRKVQTIVELMDGETLVIAGLIQNSSSRNKNQVPILGNIPGLGTLFSVTNDKKNENEVIIFITPKIVDNSVNINSL